MTTELQSVIQNPDLIKDHMRILARGINDSIGFINRGYSESVSKSITASSTADDTATIVYASSTGGAVNFTLPTAASVKYRYYTVFKTDSSTNAVTIQAASTSESINGSTSSSTTTQYNSTTVHSDGSAWYKI